MNEFIIYNFLKLKTSFLQLNMNAEERIYQLREELNLHTYNYYVLDNATISDFEFDVKLKE